MKTYIVGGFVRDTLLGLTPKDKDFVVVGATATDVENMLAQGFQRVGADFPVFLHPVTGDEYALARTERKVAAGYSGFEAFTSPDLTLADDLLRRDLTINAMAMDMETGEIIDPFGGQDALKAGILRHVSPAFAEDPLRVLRVARFAARYKFNVAHETELLMKQLVDSGELEHLSPERIWAETAKIFDEHNTFGGLVVLNNCGALRHVLADPSAQVMLDFVGRKGIEKFNALSPTGKFIALTHGFNYDASWMQTMRVPTDLQKAYLMFNKVSTRFGVFDTLTAPAKVRFLMDVGAFNNAATFASIQDVLTWFAPTAKFTTFAATVAAAKTVDCELVAKTNKANVAEAIFDARSAAVESA